MCRYEQRSLNIDRSAGSAAKGPVRTERLWEAPWHADWCAHFCYRALFIAGCEKERKWETCLVVCKCGFTVHPFMNDHVTTLEPSPLSKGFLSLEVFLGDVMAGLTSLRLRQSQASWQTNGCVDLTGGTGYWPKNQGSMAQGSFMHRCFTYLENPGAIGVGRFAQHAWGTLPLLSPLLGPAAALAKTGKYLGWS